MLAHERPREKCAMKMKGRKIDDHVNSFWGEGAQ